MPQKMNCYPAVPPWLMPQPPPGYVAAPFPVAGLFTCHPAGSQQPTATPPPPPYLECYPAPASATATPVKPAQPSLPRKAKVEPPPPQRKKRNPWSPPDLDAKNGEQYMFDRAENHTKVHVFNKAAPIWSKKYEKADLLFRVFKVSFNYTIKMLIEIVLDKEEEKCKDWALTEVIEIGNGKFDKGETFEYTDGKSDKTLKSLGWTAKRGDSVPPVWIVVHKVDFKK